MREKRFISLFRAYSYSLSPASPSVPLVRETGSKFAFPSCAIVALALSPSSERAVDARLFMHRLLREVARIL